MTIRLNKVTRDLNVGIATVVEFLQKKGYTIEANPNTKITEEQYAVLVKEFSTDKNLKKESEKFIQERQSKERNKASIAIEGYEEPKKEEEIDLRPKFKTVGKIDLDSLNKRPAAPKVEEPVKVDEPEVVAPEPTPEVQNSVKENQPEPVVVEPEVKEVEPQEVHMEKATSEANNTQKKEEEGVFKIRPTEFKSAINVLGKIDLDALNQSTRPKKKSKEEKRKERDEKEKLRQQQRQQMKDAIIKEIRKTDDKNVKDTDEEGSKKKKRNRIGKERVDINAPSNQGGGQRKDNNAGHAGKNNAQGKPGKDQGKPNKDRFKKPAPKVEVSDEDVAKQVKETLARLTNKSKNKAANLIKIIKI